tara:strand:- start:6 stop:551 length:546 start_codon:yes stop_codon:yes gene_type:complete
MEYVPYKVQPAITWEDRAAHRIMELEGLNYSFKAIHQREDYSLRPSGRVTVAYKEPKKENVYAIDYGDNTGKKGQYSTERDAEVNLKTKLIPEYIRRSRNIFPDYDTYSEKLKIEILQSVYRGWDSHDTAKLIKKGDFFLAAIEFLDHDDYRAAIAPNSTTRGIATRMEALSKALQEEGEM